jgi:tetratricopeptide (TPR) repeat protein
MAVREGHEEFAEWLLERGASVVLTDKRDYTLLHLAALHGHARVVARALDLGADPNAESTTEHTPLDGAHEGEHEEIAALLRARGAYRVQASEGGTEDWITKADAATDRGDLDEAIDCLDRAVARHPRAVRAFVHKGDLLRQRGRLRESLDCYDRAIAIEPGFSGGMAWGNKGVVLQELNRLEEAARCYEEVLRLNPEDAIACLNLGVLRHNAGRTDDAIRWYRAALERDPSYVQAKYYLAGALRERDSDPE